MSSVPHLSEVQLPSLTSIVEKLAKPGFVNTMKGIEKNAAKEPCVESEVADSDDMIIDSGEDMGKDLNCDKPKDIEKSSPSPLISTVSDLVIKMKQAEALNDVKSPSPTTPEFLMEDSPVRASSGRSTPEYLMTPPEIQEERRKERVRRQAELEKKSSKTSDRKKHHSDADKRGRSSVQEKKSRHLDCQASSKSDERRKSETRRRQARKRSDSKKQISGQEPSQISQEPSLISQEPSLISQEPSLIPLLAESPPPPPPPPPPRGTVVIHDHGETAAPDSSLSNGQSGDSAPLVYVNNNKVYVNNNSQLPSKLTNLATHDFSNGSMVRKRSRLDPPTAPSTLSVTDIMGSPSVMLTALNDSYALEQFNDAWTKEAQSPTTYSEGNFNSSTDFLHFIFLPSTFYGED
jgi:hypothetical protein